MHKHHIWDNLLVNKKIRIHGSGSYGGLALWAWFSIQRFKKTTKCLALKCINDLALKSTYGTTGRSWIARA